MRQIIARLRRDERGDLDDVVGLSVVIPGVLFVAVAVVFMFGQSANVHSQVQAAAFAAARDASLSGNAGTATPNAIAAAQRSLSDGGVSCTSLDVQLDLAALDTPLGSTGNVSATVACTFNYSAALMPWMPGTGTVTQTAVSPTDPYRERP